MCCGRTLRPEALAYFRRTVRHAWENTVFYPAFWKEKGFCPGDISAVEPEDIPVLTKQDLVEYRNRRLAIGAGSSDSSFRVDCLTEESIADEQGLSGIREAARQQMDSLHEKKRMRNVRYEIEFPAQLLRNSISGKVPLTVR